MSQCVAVCCSVFHHVANLLQSVGSWLPPHPCLCCYARLLPSTVVCCSVLQFVAVCRSVSQCVAVCCSVFHHVANLLQSVGSWLPLHLCLCCCACLLPSTAVCCSVMQFVIMYRSASQCVTVCSSMLQFICATAPDCCLIRQCIAVYCTLL